jgi:hypothetical protein
MFESLMEMRGERERGRGFDEFDVESISNLKS